MRSFEFVTDHLQARLLNNVNTCVFFQQLVTDTYKQDVNIVLLVPNCL